MTPSRARRPIRFYGKAYWDAVWRDWSERQRDRLWRQYSDSVNRSFLERFLNSCQARRLLKTDMFDEAASEGLCPFLKARSARVVGIDISEQVLRAARNGGGVAPVCTDVKTLPFAENAFDVVVCISTLDHFRTQDELFSALRELKRVLDRGGELLLTIDNPANPVVAVRNRLPFSLLKKIGLVPYYVGATCGPRRLRQALEQAGFEIRETGALLHCPRALAIAILRLLEWFPSRAAHGRIVRVLNWFERLSRWPTRYLTGSFLYVRAVKCA